jgi:hypothetical protein
MLPKLDERVQRCRYCLREMNVSSEAYDENPFCAQCVSERLRNSVVGPPAKEFFGRYVRFIPRVLRKHS